MLSDQFLVAPQISKADLALVKAKGIRSVICNRPDGEEADQPTFEEMSVTAKHLGLHMRHIPVSGGTVQDADVALFKDALGDLPKPILAYCRSGTRPPRCGLWRKPRRCPWPISCGQRSRPDMT
ncbi:TIGR01244 family sulfur transferase [uncultured Sulfitobacter sp.]|uniref:TIGR01244 family sulfur transferase n=1 Tax=uncultured Sulfitobacter sp. TaxID=191468 RepID=UPI00261DE7C1|nr:TIGR01244 family sulfur transferase [uncultured Sulfitobacter sp.]